MLQVEEVSNLEECVYISSAEGRSKLISEGVSYMMGINSLGEGVEVSVDQHSEVEDDYLNMEITTYHNNGTVRIEQYDELGKKDGEIVGGIRHF